jgi:oligoendopeptidase F
MTLNITHTPTDLAEITWAQIEPLAQELVSRPVDAASLESWLADWSEFSRLISEISQRRYVAFTVDTEDAVARQQYDAYLEVIFPASQEVEQKLKEKLLSSDLEPAGLEMPLKNMRAEADLFREANLPLLGEELKLANEYDQIIGAQTVQWEGQELTIAQLYPILQDLDRAKRERAWRLAAERQLADRPAINALWQRMLELRQRIAHNADRPDYRAYRWQQLLRFDYTPQDCLDFHTAIQQVAVPVSTRLYESRRQRLSLESLRPWDLDVDLYADQPLRPYNDIAELVEKTSTIFHRVDSQLGAYFDIMRQENLLDLENRKGKAPGGYCTNYDIVHRPFIFMNGVGTHDDVQTLLHEGGHAFHVFETASLPYHSQTLFPMEFAEVASMGMEMLSAPYLTADQGGFYTPPEAARARLEHMSAQVRFWPYMAVVDAFQHWAYTHLEDAKNPDHCDAWWMELWQRFMPDVDWSGFEDACKTGWQRKLHIFEAPFYYVEYGLAQIGAVQVFRNALRNQAGAVEAYRKALALGGTVPLPELYRAAGARLAFDAGTLGEVIGLLDTTMQDLERQFLSG